MRFRKVPISRWTFRSAVVAVIAASCFGLSARYGISQLNDDNFSQSPLAKGSRLFSYEEETRTRIVSQSVLPRIDQAPTATVPTQDELSSQRPRSRKAVIPNDPNSVTFDEFVKMFNEPEQSESSTETPEKAPHPLVDVDPDFVAFSELEEQKKAESLTSREQPVPETTVLALSEKESVEQPVLVPHQDAFEVPSQDTVESEPSVIIVPAEKQNSEPALEDVIPEVQENPFAGFELETTPLPTQPIEDADHSHLPAVTMGDDQSDGEQESSLPSNETDLSVDYNQPIAITPGFGNALVTSNDESPILITSMHSNVPRPTFRDHSKSVKPATHSLPAKPIVTTNRSESVSEKKQSTSTGKEAIQPRTKTFVASFTSNRPLSLTGNTPVHSMSFQTETQKTTTVQKATTGQEVILPSLPMAEEGRPILRFDEIDASSAEKEQGPVLAKEATTFLPADLYSSPKEKLADEEIGFPVLVAQADTVDGSRANSRPPVQASPIPSQTDSPVADLTPSDDVYIAKNTSLEISPSLFIGAVIGIIALLLLYHRR